MQLARDALIERIFGALRLIPVESLIARVVQIGMLLAAPVLIIRSIQSWDRPLLTCLVDMRTGPLADVAAVVSILGNPTPYFLVAALAFLVFKGAWPNAIRANGALFALVAATAPALSTDLLKVLFARSRPALFLEQGIYEFRFFQNAPEFASFPSEEATVVAAVASALSVLFPAYRSSLFLLAVVIAACRLVLAVSYLSDVLAGFCIGVCFVSILHAGFTRFGLPLSVLPRRASRP
jgi:membrane-associated phospholipid phosphatase